MRRHIFALALVLSLAAPAVAQAQITVVINEPQVANPFRFGHTLFVRATVTSVAQLSSVVATVSGRAQPLAFAAGAWTGTITTSDLPYGPTTLSVVATDVNSLTSQAQRNVFHDNPPTLEYLAPEWNALARPDVHVRARCTDDGGPCQLRAALSGAPPSVGEIDTIVSLALVEGQQLNYTITATDQAGQSASQWKPVWVESSPRLSLMATYPGLILDINDTQALVLNEFAPRMALIVDRLSGATQSIYTEGPRTVTGGKLTPAGALFRTTVVGDVTPNLHEWRNGALTDIADLATDEDPAIAGNWAVFSRVPAPCCLVTELVRRHLLTGAETIISTTALNNHNTVTTAGDVIYAEPSGVGDYDLYRYSGGSVTPEVVDPGSTAFGPRTDGVIVAYTSFANSANTTMLHTPSGEEVLATSQTYGPNYNAYRVVNGWTAFERPGTGGSTQIWTRAPNGTLRQITSTGGQVMLDGLNEQGDVVYRVFVGGSSRRYVARAAETAPVEMGSMLGTPVWVDGYWSVLVGPHLLRFVNTWTALLSEGATGTFFDFDVAILNPGQAAAPTRLTFLGESGSRVDVTRTIPAHARATVHVDDVPGLADTSVSTVVTSTNGSPLVVERTMTWDATGYGGHSGSAVDAPRMRWLFAEGSQGYFDTFLLLVNNQTTAGTARLRFLVEGATPVERTVPLPAGSRITVYAGAIPELVNRSFSTVVEADVPIAAERAMYFGGPPLWAGGHESAGVPEASRRWYHAEGATGSLFDTFILLANPNTTETPVSLLFLTDAGVPVSYSLTLPALSRATISAESVSPALANASFATTVQADLPIVSERAMYWSTTGGPWQEAHNSFGVTATATKWATADGRVGGARGYQTYVLVANPSASETANLTATFMREDGAQFTRTFTLGPNRRLNIFCNDVPELADANFGVVVQSMNSVPIAVERATYWDANGVTWAGGTNVTATPIP